MSKLSDSPFKCKYRKDDLCSLPFTSNPCPENQYKGHCCLFCPKLWSCFFCCPKVMSYLTYEKSNPSKFTPQEKRAIKKIQFKADVREIGNPSVRKEEKKEDENKQKR